MTHRPFLKLFFRYLISLKNFLPHPEKVKKVAPLFSSANNSGSLPDLILWEKNVQHNYCEFSSAKIIAPTMPASLPSFALMTRKFLVICLIA